MTTKHTPATPLPWNDGPVFQTDHRGLFFSDTSKPGKWQRRLDSDSIQRGLFEPDDASYIAHACNAYPQLVEALADALGLCSPQELADAAYPDNLSRRASWIRKAQATLRACGEAQ